MSDETLITSATNTLELEAAGITQLAKALNDDLGPEFIKAVETISNAQQNNGRVIISGMGKSGHIGQKSLQPSPPPGRPPFLSIHQRLDMATLA